MPSLRDFPVTATARATAIRDIMVRESRRLHQPNFTAIGPDDLFHLFRLYDEQFFGSRLAQTVIDQTNAPLTFRLSAAMTRAGGKTIRPKSRRSRAKPGFHYELQLPAACSS